MASDGDRNKQTVILPNPGGRRPVADKPAPMDPPATDEWSRDPWPAGGGGNGGAPAGAGAGAGAGAPPANPENSPIGAAALLRSEAALNNNEMLRAAAPLLLMLGKLRAGLVRAQSATIMEEVARSIDGFEAAMTQSGYSADQSQVAKYALAATADDVVQNIPVDDRRLWTQYSMLSQFFGERTGGIRFFEELGRMKADPLANIDVLELMYACLAVGFEGVHRTSPGGMAALQQIQRDLYDVIRRVRPRESFELSPRWQGSGIKPRDKRNRVPLWAVAAFALALVFGSFLGLRLMLSGGAAEVEEELLALYPLAPVTLVRPDYVPPAPLPPEPEPIVVAPAEPVPLAPPPPTPCEDVRAALLSDIEGARIDIGECGGDLRLTIGDRPGLVLFRSASADISDDYAAIIARIAPVIDQVPGAVTVIGHTDSVPYRGVRFASNYDLSVKRAEAVTRLLREVSGNPERFETKGQGANVPIDDNGTAGGRARNRRVDIVIAETE
ncbi:type IVB secretion system protein IcmH/DotU [Acuticoccus sp. MNP-M23]|uniref:type IVB secretion system protein IcmH/DotU n=1 Tax=Acuticoccus sp. MNP-M23 TaxID=3072793 RepID=UPI002816023C|nr:type IVB secretion system protein IcmH/DotU [Acuticoccus sp. MNP-M23]WMS44144.1 type IVB secretion system protein IcmH/DotU [Acuticoccus sp. MNP-M23]